MTKNSHQLQLLQAKVMELMAEITQLKISIEEKKSVQQTIISKPNFTQQILEQQMYNKLFKAFSKRFKYSSFIKF